MRTEFRLPTTPDKERAPARSGVPPVEAVRRALRILGCFSLDRSKLGISAIARELGMHKSTVHRLLTTLELEGFVHQVDGNRYALSWKLFELGATVPEWHGIRQAVLRVLATLAEETGETAHLAVMEEGEVLYLEKVEGSHRLRMPSAVGRRVPLHCTALGKVLLSGLDERALMPMIHRGVLQAFTPHTITDPKKLEAEVQRVRKAGFAIDHEEIEEGLMCIAAPVVSSDHEVCGAISIAGPLSRLDTRRDEYTDAVRRASAALSAELGASALRLREACGSPSSTGTTDARGTQQSTSGWPHDPHT